MMRNAQLNLITHDHTQAFQLLSEGKIDKETYYVHDGPAETYQWTWQDH